MRRAAAALALCLAAGRPVRAEEPAPLTEDFRDLQSVLDQPILATASQALETASSAPATSTSISADELRRYGIRSLDEAINFLSLGMVTQNPLHAVDVGARGVLLTSDFGNHVLLLVNGHALNEQWDGTAYFERGLAIPFELVDHIEIVLGPGSVLYGSNAMLGVINVITKRASAFSGAHLVAESELPTSWRGAAGYGRAFTLFGAPGELTIAVDYYRQDGPSFTFGPQRYGDDAITGQPKRFDPAGTNAGVWGGRADDSYWTEIPSAYARVALGSFALDLRAARYRRGTPYVNQFNQAVGDFDDPGSWEQDRWASADLKHHATLSTTVELRSRLYGDLYQYDQQMRSSAAEDCAAGQTSGCVRKALGLSRSAGLEEQLFFDWTNDGRWLTLAGVDGRVRHAGSQLDVFDRETGALGETVGHVRRTERAVGVYVQQALVPTPWLDLSAGLRFDDDQRFGRHLSPRLAVSVAAWSGGTLKAIASEAFRAPTLYERAYADPLSQIAAPRLRPEVVRSVEALVEQRLGSHRVLLGAFASLWDDMVLLESVDEAALEQAKSTGAITPDATSAMQYQNVSELRNYGVNAAFEGAALKGALRYGLNVTAARARRELRGGEQVDLTVTPQLFGNARVSYELPGALPTVSLVTAVFGRRLADRAHDGLFSPTPRAPAQALFRGTIAGPLPWVTGLSYRLTADLATAGRNPYVVGPVQAATPEHPAAELSPVDRFRAAVGLQYDFGH